MEYERQNISKAIPIPTSLLDFLLHRQSPSALLHFNHRPRPPHRFERIVTWFPIWNSFLHFSLCRINVLLADRLFFSVKQSGWYQRRSMLASILFFFFFSFIFHAHMCNVSFFFRWLPLLSDYDARIIILGMYEIIKDKEYRIYKSRLSEINLFSDL